MDLLVVSVFFFLSPLLSLGSSDRSHNALLGGHSLPQGTTETASAKPPHAGKRGGLKSQIQMSKQIACSYEVFCLL